MERCVFVVCARGDLRAVFNEHVGSEWEPFDARIVERRAPVVVLIVQQLAHIHLNTITSQADLLSS